jgi:hypothetical protein
MDGFSWKIAKVEDCVAIFGTRLEARGHRCSFGRESDKGTGELTQIILTPAYASALFASDISCFKFVVFHMFSYCYTVPFLTQARKYYNETYNHLCSLGIKPI